MEIQNVGYKHIVLAVDHSDVEWLRAAARNAEWAAQGMGLRKEATGIDATTRPEDAARVFGNLYSFFDVLVMALRWDEHCAAELDAEDPQGAAENVAAGK